MVKVVHFVARMVVWKAMGAVTEQYLFRRKKYLILDSRPVQEGIACNGNVELEHCRGEKAGVVRLDCNTQEKICEQFNHN